MNVAVIGLGMIGGSIARGLAESGYAACIYGKDTDPGAQDLALERGIIQGILDVRLHGGEINLWVLAVPPLSVGACLEFIAPHVQPTSAVTDTASVKCAVMQQVPAELHSVFVGGHPMAGRASKGLESSHPDLFEGQPWILCPNSASPEALKRVEQLVFALDAVPVVMSSQEHDEHVALLSHLPHLLANLMVNSANCLRQPSVAGPSWSGISRIAGNHPELWKEIFVGNSEMIVAASRELRKKLEEAEALLSAKDGATLQKIIEQAAEKG